MKSNLSINVDLMRNRRMRNKRGDAPEESAPMIPSKQKMSIADEIRAKKKKDPEMMSDGGMVPDYADNEAIDDFSDGNFGADDLLDSEGGEDSPELRRKKRLQAIFGR